MTVSVSAASAASGDVETIAVFVFDDMTPSEPFSSLPTDDLTALHFEGKAGQTQQVRVDGKNVVAVGLGARDSVTTDTYRRAAAMAARATKTPSLAILAAAESQAVAEGVVLGAYRFTKYKTSPSPSPLQTVEVVGGDAVQIEAGVRIATAVGLARDLINEPPGNLTPTDLANIAVDVAGNNGLQIDVWDKARIEHERLGGLLGVAAGSDQEPRFIRLAYEPEGAKRTFALVGKGITFDSGGLSLKTGDGMVEMKTDMGGAAAVLATMSVLTHFAPQVRVVGFIAASENLPGPSATKPGDVLRARNGKTMEVLNTDAEGRLVLSDALSLAAEENPDLIIDLATLTGAVKFALGNDVAGLFSNNDGLRDALLASADATNEPAWQLPLWERYRKLIDGSVGDIKNMASSGGSGVITAALFLREFVDGKPWAHFDIAGTARTDGDDAYLAKGATGYGVRLLVDVLRNHDSLQLS